MLLSELQGEWLPVDYSHLQLHKNYFSVWLHLFWVKFLALLPLLSLVKLLQSSCSCSPQLALLLFPLQDFFPKLNIPRHLLNRPSEILVNWKVSQEGLCFQFSYSPGKWECSKPGKRGKAFGAEELPAQNYPGRCTHLPRCLEEAETRLSSPNIILYLQTVWVLAHCNFNGSAGESRSEELKDYPGYREDWCSVINQPDWVWILKEQHSLNTADAH